MLNKIHFASSSLSGRLHLSHLSSVKTYSTSNTQTIMTTQNSQIFGSINTFEPSEILQAAPYSCAVKSQELILKMFGQNISEEQLSNEAILHNWYDPASGTPLNCIGNLLELHGVDVDAKVEANVYDLMLQLAQGHQVIVTVDSNELLNPGLMSDFCDLLNPNGVNHAIVVTGVDTTNPDDIRILVTDPGTGEAASYPVEQFKDAWEDSTFHMVHTTSAPLQHEIDKRFAGDSLHYARK